MLSSSAGEALRFFLVSLTGLVLDIGIAWWLIAAFAVPELLAAAIGFSVATAANYFAHQVWTFRGRVNGVSWRGLLRFCLVVGAALLIRLVCLGWIVDVLPGAGIVVPLRLGLAAAVSFVFTFLMSRLLVFKPEH